MIKKLFNSLKKWDYRLKFLMVGGLNTVVGVGSYWLILIMFGLDITKTNADATVPVIVATLLSQILGLTNSYFWNKFFTFESKKKNKTEFVKFISVYAVAFGMDYFLKFALRKIDGFNEIIIAVVTTIVTMIISFIGQKFFVFEHKKVKSEIEDKSSIPEPATDTDIQNKENAE